MGTRCLSANWWLSAVANSTNFCNVNSNGNVNYNNASNVNGVRPRFIAPVQPQLRDTACGPVL